MSERITLHIRVKKKFKEKLLEVAGKGLVSKFVILAVEEKIARMQKNERHEHGGFQK